jgi:hypothetical protein
MKAATKKQPIASRDSARPEVKSKLLNNFWTTFEALWTAFESLLEAF